MSSTSELQLRLEQLNDAFCPSGPIDQERLFSGRVRQRQQLAEAISSPGSHAVVFGERGVGKTSLTATSVATARARDIMALRVNCSSDDDYQTVWDSVADQLREQQYLPGFDSKWAEPIASFLELVGHDAPNLVEPDRVRIALQRLAVAGRVVIFFDEYDQLVDPDVSRQMAHTIKSLSDHLVKATIGIVGVATDIDELIVGHQSVQRCLHQVQMPRMGADEIADIVERGLQEMNLQSAADVTYFIQKSALGFPSYAHRLGRSFARCALEAGSTGVSMKDLPCAIDDTVSGIEQSMRSLYNDSVHSIHKDALYKDVLLACALATTDDEGYFPPRNLAEPLSTLLNRSVRSDKYNRHLGEFATSRGPVLDRKGGDRHWRYRFKDPAMEPYVVLLGVAAERVTFVEPQQTTELPFDEG